ncbi:hypothetical protein [Streptomyces sediminimaris]|uniref:hypothetical protein n=1 Tax=Streptomyces sediminimaris TaxID=3383721 RepID=UPI00399ADD02
MSHGGARRAGARAAVTNTSTPSRSAQYFAVVVIMDLIGDIAAIRIPLPQHGDVTPEELYTEAREKAEQARADYASALEVPHDDLREDPQLIAPGNARAAREAADREIRHLLAHGRDFHGGRPYKLQPLARAGGMTPSGIRTAYGPSETETVARGIGRTPDSRRARPPVTPEPS